MAKEIYSTKDICKIFGVGRETLRHYEKIGILQPAVNPKNGYREYGYWDVGMMVDILRYRAMGLPLSEVKEAIYQLSYHDTVEMLQNQLKSYQEQIALYEIMAEKAKKDLAYMQFAKRHLNELTQVRISDLFFVPFVEAEEDNPQWFQTMQNALKYSQFFVTTWIMDAYSYPNDANVLSGLGFLAERKYADYFQVIQGIEIPASEVIGAIYDVPGRDKVTFEYFTEFEAGVREWKQEKEANGQAVKLSDETYAVLLTRFYDEKQMYHQYFCVFKRLL